MTVTELSNELGVCGCGNPEDYLQYIKGILEILADRDEDFEKAMADKKAYFKSGNGEEMFVMYWLDEKGFTEHGGSVYGSWLSATGWDFLKKLREMTEDEE